MLGDHLVFPILLSMDLAASRAFYHDTLGLDVLREDDERIIFRCGAGSAVDGDPEHDRDGRPADPAGMARSGPQGRARRPARPRCPDPGVRLPDLETEDGIADMGFAWAAWTHRPESGTSSGSSR